MFRFFKKKPPAPPASTPAAPPPEADTSAPPIPAVPPPEPALAPAPSVPAPLPPEQAPAPASTPAPAFDATPVAAPTPESFAVPKPLDAPVHTAAPESTTVPATQNEFAAGVTQAPAVVPSVPSTPSAYAQPSVPAAAPVQVTPPVPAAAPVQVTPPVPAAAPVQVTPPVQPAAPVQVTPPVPAAAPVHATPLAQTPPPPAVTPIKPSLPIAPAPTPAPEPAKKASWLSRLKQGLSRTGQTIGNLFIDVPVDENLFEELESALIMADAGVEATGKLLTALRARVKKDRLDDATKVKRALREILADHLRPLEKKFDTNRAQPLVVMIAGVNGAGKTTSIGKLAHTFQQQGASVLLAAGDTFRAAAREQLVEWGRRNNVTVISQDGGDPAAVAFDAVNAGRARKTGVVMIDTAGRLPTQLHLMEELKKIRRVIGKADPQAPHEVLLVIDGNTGQNAIAQIRAFDAAITLTGLVVTKLDGTAKGGTLAAVAAGSQGVRPVPVYWIGVGEGMQDLQPFVADEFAQALLGD